MDPLSVAASVIAVVQIADRIIDLCRAYITGVKDAPAELRAILIEVGSVKCVLEVIELLDTSGEAEIAFQGVKILEKLQGPLEGCKEALNALEGLFPPQSETAATGKRKRLALSLTTLAWPFKREKALKFLEEIGRHKSTIALGLTTEAAQDLKHIRKNVEKIGEAMTEAEMMKVLKWLVTTDPSPNHNNACKLHEDHTGQWLTNSREYANWKSGRSRFIWLHGIPGAGKTILHSFIAEDVKRHCRDIESSACAFYYCYFARDQDETTHLLRWVISELCRRIGGIPARIHTKYKGGLDHLVEGTLLSMLEAVAENFSRIYITIDALDESVNREHLLKLLHKIFGHTKLGNIQLLATSRKEFDIESALSPITTELSLSNPHVDKDITTYIKGRLREDPKFRRWPESLKTETEAALVKGAKGMFRWAFCQLDILKRLHTVPEIRLALTQLPKTLDETYDRILCNIPPESQNMVYRTLSFLSCGYMINLYKLADLLAVDVENPSFDRKNRPFDLHAPVEAATCLLAYDHINPGPGTLRLAHYTVKEYLISSRIGDGPARMFQLMNDSMYALAASCYIIYMLYEDYSMKQKPLMVDAIQHWADGVRNIKSKSIKESIAPLVIQLLDPRESHYPAWKNEVLKPNTINRCPLWSDEAGAECSAFLASICWLGLIDVAQVLLDMWKDPFAFQAPLYWVRRSDYTRVYFPNADSPDKVKQTFLGLLEDESGHEILTVLQVVLIRLNTVRQLLPHILDLMVQKGADFNTCSLTGLRPLNTLLNCQSRRSEWLGGSSHRQFCLDFLLDSGAQPDPERCTITPLQSAVLGALWELPSSGSDFEVVSRRIRTILDRGAAPNRVAHDETNVKRIHHSCKLYFEKYKKHSCVWQDESEYLELALQERGTSAFYDTPLRMVENEKKMSAVPNSKSSRYLQIIEQLDRLENLLISYGAKSLHLFPVKGLPRYVEEDMEVWRNFNNPRTASSPSPSTSAKVLDAATRTESPQVKRTI